MKKVANFDHHIFGSEILNCDLLPGDGGEKNGKYIKA